MRFEKGDTVFVRSNTRDDYIGRVVEWDGLFVSLEQCSWVGDSGRFGVFMRDGIQQNTETEYIGAWTTSVSAIALWEHELPTTDKPE